MPIWTHCSPTVPTPPAPCISMRRPTPTGAICSPGAYNRPQRDEPAPECLQAAARIVLPAVLGPHEAAKVKASPSIAGGAVDGAASSPPAEATMQWQPQLGNGRRRCVSVPWHIGCRCGCERAPCIRSERLCFRIRGLHRAFPAWPVPSTPPAFSTQDVRCSTWTTRSSPTSP